MNFNTLSANPTKWSNTLKRIVWMCLTILRGWHFKGSVIYHKKKVGIILQSSFIKFFSKDKNVCWSHPNIDLNDFSLEWIELFKLNFVLIESWKVFYLNSF